MNANGFRLRHPGLVWSNSRASDTIWIRAALLRPRFHTILDACLEFGLDRVRDEWNAVVRENTAEPPRLASEVNRMLQHIAEGFADAQTGN